MDALGIFGLVLSCIGIVACMIALQQGEKKKKINCWATIKIGMHKTEVEKALGNPYAAAQIEGFEAWQYGPSEKDGEVRFQNERIVAFRKPC